MTLRSAIIRLAMSRPALRPHLVALLRDAASGKVGRAAFLYMEPKEDEPEFAQCSTCALWDGEDRCALFGDGFEVKGSDTCGFYVPGSPGTLTRKVEERVTPEVAGFERRPVRCENCVSFDRKDSACQLFEALNEALPDHFDLDPKVKAQGCCNANRPR